MHVHHILLCSADAQKRPPCGLALKFRVLDVLTRSVEAAKAIPANIQIVYDAWFNTKASLQDMRVKLAGIRFGNWVFAMAPADALAKVSPLFLQGLIKFLTQQITPQASSTAAAAAGGAGADVTSFSTVQITHQLRESTYSAFGQLAQRVPHVFASNTMVVKMLFSQLETEDVDLRLPISESLSLIASGYVAASPSILAELSTLLTSKLHVAEQRARQAALDWFKRVFPFAEMPARYACVVLAADSRSEVRSAAQAGLDVTAYMKSRHIAVDTAAADADVCVGAAHYPAYADAVAYFSSFAEGASGIRASSLQPQSLVAMLTFLENCLNASIAQGVAATVDALECHRALIDVCMRVDVSIAQASHAHEVGFVDGHCWHGSY